MRLKLGRVKEQYIFNKGKSQTNIYCMHHSGVDRIDFFVNQKWIDDVFEIFLQNSKNNRAAGQRKYKARLKPKIKNKLHNQENNKKDQNRGQAIHTFIKRAKILFKG